MKSLIKIAAVVVLFGLLTFFVGQLLFAQEKKEIKPTRPPKTENTIVRLGSESPTTQEAKEAIEQENKSSPVGKGGKTSPVFPGPDAILKAQIHIRTEQDVKTLRDLGLECCADTGICECQMTMKQLMELVGQGLSFIKASTIDTAKWAKETKPQSDKIIPPKPEPKTESPKLDDRSHVAEDEIFLLKVEIKTGKEMQDIRKVTKRVGGQCESNGKIILLRVTQEQMEALKKEGIEFDVQR